MKILIYDSHNFTLGGAQKYILFLAEILKYYGEVTIAYTGDYNFEFLEKDFDTRLKDIKFKKVGDYELKHYSSLFSVLLRDFLRKRIAKKVSRLSSKSDLFFFSSHFTSYVQPKPRAKKNISLCHFPNKLERLAMYNTKINKNSFFGRIYLGFYEFFSRLFFSPVKNSYIQDYQYLVCNSKYTQKYIIKYWKKNTELLYPPIQMNKNFFKSKKNIIVSFGRFDKRKKTLELVNAYKNLSKSLKNWKYYIFIPKFEAKYQKEDFEKFKKELEKFDNIIFFEGLGSQEIQKYLSISKIFWNLSGLGEDENKNPQNIEHFGMVNTEAMSFGCIPIIFNGGGHKEIIQNGKNGFLVNNPNELIEKTLNLISNENLRKKMAENAFEKAKDFSFEKFREKFIRILNLK